MTKQLEALIAEVKAAAEKATPGPYSIDHTGYSLNCSEGTFGDFLDMDNATFALEANPESILTLIAALEQSQRANAAQDDHINQQQDRIEQLEKGHQEAAKHITSWRRLAKQNISEREKDIAELDAARKRIAELEASPLAVKLPNRLQPGADGPDDWYLHSDPDGEYMKADDVIEAIRAAGGTVSTVEGEQ
ncbi:Uncharacterised protein [Cedecea lapagei]|uniref:Ead/Ea22-like family protein n=1 Tax=Cedecea lapagei TaxID=158823 RepID=A0A3S4IE03_9ENTR|nr:ead/Ea22-like family protein [Cedecea lapagei]VEB97387.1 Uncharacterised protein [Cedecea lapagei]